jgi:hypothetical protein
MLGFLGALLGDDHEVTLAWIAIIRRYETVESRLHYDIESKHGVRLDTELFVFHIQLILRDWLEDQTCTGQRFTVPEPDFYHHIKSFERQKNMHWLPSVNNVPALIALSSSPHLPAATPILADVTPMERRAQVVAAAAATPRVQTDVGTRMRDLIRHARFTGNSAFANTVCAHHVDEAMALSGGDASLSHITRGGARVAVCISWHAKGSCFQHCTRCATHAPLSYAELVTFNTWCEIAFA